MIKKYLFDFDGTLVDSMPTYAALMLRILNENNATYGDDIIKIITPLGFKGTAKYFREVLGMQLSEEALGQLMQDYAIYEYTYNVPAKKHVIETLRKLKDAGCDLNVLTASPHITLDPCLKRLGIYDIFTNVWSCDDFATTKADPEIYRMVAKELDCQVEDVLFLDDNINADKTAKQAGMKVCGVFDPTSADMVDEMKAVCDMYIYDFRELL
jgi:HAD superfamily hydrolase (TIGR01509 family)